MQETFLLPQPEQDTSFNKRFLLFQGLNMMVKTGR